MEDDVPELVPPPLVEDPPLGVLAPVELPLPEDVDDPEWLRIQIRHGPTFACLLLMVIAAVWPTSASVGVPLRLPVAGSKLAQLG